MIKITVFQCYKYFNIKIQTSQQNMIKSLSKYSKQNYQTPSWTQQGSSQLTDQNSQSYFQQSKRTSQMSIIDKIKASKNIDLDEIDISHKMTKIGRSRNDEDNGRQNVSNQISQAKRFVPIKQDIQSFSPFAQKKQKNHMDSQKKAIPLQKQNLKYTPSRSKLLNPKQSWTGKTMRQKSLVNLATQRSNISRSPLVISKHQQLYLDSRKKQIKKSAEQIIENEYFKKKHPFRPQIGEISEFLAEEKFERMKEKQKFEREFQEFDQWKEERKFCRSATQSAKKKQMDQLDIQNKKLDMEKQAQLKNYTMLKQFFFYLSEASLILKFVHLSSKKLCELPTPCIKFLEPIIEAFYKNKNVYSLSWLQFLSEFNLKVNKRKTFYGLIEKWFLVKFGVKFQGAGMRISEDEKFNCSKNKDDDSTYIGPSMFNCGDSADKDQTRRFHLKPR